MTDVAHTTPLGPVVLSQQQAVEQVIVAMAQLGQPTGPLDKIKIGKLIETLYANRLYLVYFPQKG